MFGVCPRASKKKIINKAVGGMAREKIKVEIKQEGGGVFIRDTVIGCEAGSRRTNGQI